MFSKNPFTTPKPENLLNLILTLSTNEQDLVLDFFLGSGTTAAVAHKMNRQYIGIEQMDYIETISVERMKKVIVGEQGGISKAVNWQGGGEFVYVELAQYNQMAKQQIEQATDFCTLLAIFTALQNKYFLKYNVNVKKFAEEILPSDEFKALDLNQQKSMILAMLDLNQMYLCYDEIDDEIHQLTENDKAFSRAFYGENN